MMENSQKFRTYVSRYLWKSHSINLQTNNQKFLRSVIKCLRRTNGVVTMVIKLWLLNTPIWFECNVMCHDFFVTIFNRYLNFVIEVFLGDEVDSRVIMVSVNNLSIGDNSLGFTELHLLFFCIRRASKQFWEMWN